MPIVSNEVTIEGVQTDEIWTVLCDFERYPDLMEDVLSVTYVSRDKLTSISDWRILLNGSEMSWRERDCYQDNKVVEFEQIEGDLEIWRGSWAIIEEGENALVRLEVEFDIGIPSLAATLDPIGIRAIKTNSLQMLNAIRARSLSVRN
ncbi:type II toxin-antitoxin system RatA family toxin [Erythrobacter sp.]|uniref:type II toxin-antitoxin system RatA family toxin n=1 Tax=Erythrobacter sp. TaxID=1042 RepID=UPI003C7167CE